MKEGTQWEETHKRSAHAAMMMITHMAISSAAVKLFQES